MATDGDKEKIQKLLHDLEVPEIKPSQRCGNLIKELKKKYELLVSEEESNDNVVEEMYENPYDVDQQALKEIEEQLKILMKNRKQYKKETTELSTLDLDCKRPWRTNSSRDKILRLDCELKSHQEKGSQLISPLSEVEMRTLIKECQEENSVSSPVPGDRVKLALNQTKSSLSNFQYKKIENSTALALLPEANVDDKLMN